MKTAFKVMSILLLIYYGIIAVIGVLGIVGAGAATVGKTGGEAAFGGVAILIILLGSYGWRRVGDPRILLREGVCDCAQANHIR